MARKATKKKGDGKYYCLWCGGEIKWRSRSGLCGECRVAKLRRNILQLQNKRGKFYKKWLEGVLRHAAKAAEELERLNQKSRSKK